MLMLQLTSAHGPQECQIAVHKALRAVCLDAQHMQLDVSVLEEYPTDHGYLSVAIGISGDSTQLSIFQKKWVGTLLWRCASPVRRGYPRKNWYIAIQRLENVLPENVFSDRDVEYTTCRSSGKGGQHVNKTDTAVHARHTPTGLHVKVQTERSQHQNKVIARLLLASKLQQLHTQNMSMQKTKKRSLHWEVERGNPTNTFTGDSFELLL